MVDCEVHRDIDLTLLVIVFTHGFVNWGICTVGVCTTVFVVVVVSDFIYTQNPILSHITNHTTLNFSHAIPAFPNQVHDP